MKKIEKGIKFVSEHLDMFRCTVDGEPYDHVEGNTLVCAHNHRLDINKNCQPTHNASWMWELVKGRHSPVC